MNWVWHLKISSYLLDSYIDKAKPIRSSFSKKHDNFSLSYSERFYMNGDFELYNVLF